MRHPKISVVTVVRNAAAVISGTIESVVSQTYPNLEYIVLDGGSVDGTQEVVTTYLSSIAHFASEPDDGIYHAMNKALTVCTGDYVYFLNAGDTFFSIDTVSRLATFAEQIGGENTIIYGDIILQGNPPLKVGFKRLSRLRLLQKTICHQAALHHIKLFDTVGPFDMRFRLKGDHEWYVRAISKAHFSRIELPIAFYDPSGVSSRELDAMQREGQAIIDRYSRPWERLVLSGLKLMRGVKRACIKA